MKGRSSKKSDAKRIGVRWKKAQKVLRLNARRLLRRAGVVGVDLGIKRTRGLLVAGPCIRVHVARKIVDEELHPCRKFPKSIQGIPLDVVVSRFRMGSCPDESFGHRVFLPRIMGGCSIGDFGDGEFGTLGAIATDVNGTLGGITCAHVTNCNLKTIVFQPHEIGSVIGATIDDVFTATADAAFIALNNDRPVVAELLNHGPMSNAPIDVTLVQLPAEVELVGACSGVTTGLLISINFQGWIEDANGSRFVREQMCVEPRGIPVFSRRGDSGGAIIKGNQFAGIVIAASDEGFGGTALATPMKVVLEELSLTLK